MGFGRNGGRSKPGIWPCAACFGRMRPPYSVVITKEGNLIVHGAAKDCHAEARAKILARSIGAPSREIPIDLFKDSSDNFKRGTLT